MEIEAHPNYQLLVEKSAKSHAEGRSLGHVNDADIAWARLYSHAFRGHTIGAFHATRLALKSLAPPSAAIDHAIEVLEDLANAAMDPIESDFRALLSTFHRYHQGLLRVLADVKTGVTDSGFEQLARIRDRFVAAMRQILTCNGIYLTRDDYVPDQASLIVPNLGITIVPLVYGDQHSWNLAYLPGPTRDVPRHLHRHGIEIHLGYSPMHGYMVLGDHRSEVTEGYALPIPPNTRHGYINSGDRAHNVPFIFGYPKFGGWGVFLDVEPHPAEWKDLTDVPHAGPAMNHAIYLEREIAAAARETQSLRWTILPAARTFGQGIGGIELAVARVTRDGLRLPADSFRIVSIVQGDGFVEMAGLRRSLSPHDHFGIPAGMAATLYQRGEQPFVLLDALLKSNPAARG